jgi:pSer/pThr/pTyr-binding forkhead associated (FHA) protein
VATLKITDASGRKWEQELYPHLSYTIGRSPSNHIVLHDPRASRHHAKISFNNGGFVLIDGYETDGELRRSINRVFVNEEPIFEKQLANEDEIIIGSSKLIFNDFSSLAAVDFDDRPIGQTQLLLSTDDVMHSVRTEI